MPKLTQLLETVRITPLDTLTTGMGERATLIVALGMIGPDAKDAVPVILRVVDDAKVAEWESQYAAVAFGQIGADAEPAIPYLMKHLRKATDNKWRGKIAHSLAQVGKASVPVLVEAIADEQAGLAEFVQSSLAEIGQDAVPAVITAVQSSNPLMRERAAFTIALLSEQNPSAIAAHLNEITPLLGDKNYKVRLSALDTLGILGSRAVSAIPQIEELKQDPESKQVREAAKEVLKNLRDTK